jgi:hypothetical protein
MDNETQLVLIKGIDKTEDVTSISAQGRNTVVTFSNAKCYPYSSSNVRYFEASQTVNLDENAILIDGKQVNGYSKAVVFENHVRILHKHNKPKLILKERVKFVASCLRTKGASECLDYLKAIADAVGLPGDDGRNVLANRYERIDFIREDSILGAFLNGCLGMNENVVSTSNNQQGYGGAAKHMDAIRNIANTNDAPALSTIFPFGFNGSQKQATEQALTNQLSLIEGPPGTGKTQTILNVIANAVILGHSVAVVSSNNSATRNVFEKLEKYGVGFIAAYLGRRLNKEAFINEQPDVPDLSAWHIEPQRKHAVLQEMRILMTSLQVMLKKRNELANLMQELDTLKTEHEHFLEYCEETYGKVLVLPTRRKLSAKNVLSLWLKLQDSLESQKKVGLWRRLQLYFEHGLWGRDFYGMPADQAIASAQERYYVTRALELAHEIDTLTKSLTEYAFDEKMNAYSSMSMTLFRGFLADKYSNSQRKKYKLDDLQVDSESFIEDYPVILSTTYSLCSSLNSRFVYDYIIVDEASQVDLATGALALSCATNAVIVGDLKQLPNVVNPNDTQKTDEIFSHYTLKEAYRYSDHSILLSLAQLFPDAPKTLLREHYRCHPLIIGFCNQKFYRNELVILTSSSGSRQPLVVYRTAKGNHARDHVNQRQIDTIKQEVFPQQGLDPQRDSIGIVTPYRKQTNELQRQFCETGILADTVDKFQGQERDIIILTTVDNEISEFADNANRLNVAVSRAVSQLILVVNGNDENCDNNIGDLIKYIEYNNFAVVDSKIYSIFDYLFKAFDKERSALLAGRKAVSEYHSENLMHLLLEEILSQASFQKYDVAAHMPLKMIVRDLSLLNDREACYAMHDWTHVDFLIFNKMDRMPVLAVEVDGASFHIEGSRQSARDAMKDAILRKYDLPIIRCRTDESSERERIVSALTAASK